MHECPSSFPGSFKEFWDREKASASLLLDVRSRRRSHTRRQLGAGWRRARRGHVWRQRHEDGRRKQDRGALAEVDGEVRHDSGKKRQMWKKTSFFLVYLFPNSTLISAIDGNARIFSLLLMPRSDKKSRRIQRSLWKRWNGIPWHVSLVIQTHGRVALDWDPWSTTDWATAPQQIITSYNGRYHWMET